MHHQRNIKAEPAPNFAFSKTLSKPVSIIAQNADSAFAINACQELFTLANRFSTEIEYHVEHGQNISQLFQKGTSVPDRTVILFGSVNAPWSLEKGCTAKLRTHLPCVHRVGFVGSAVLLAAKVPHFHTHRFSVHAELSYAANELAIHAHNSSASWFRDRSVFSATGNLAAAQMVLEMISVDCGYYVAEQVQSHIGLAGAQPNTMSETENHYIRLAHGDPIVMRAISIMREHIEDPLRIEDFDQLLDLSSRQMQRSFMKQFNETPLTVYRNIRLDRADQLLKFTDMTIREISVAAGFSSTSLFSKQFQRRYSMHPVRRRELRYGQKLAKHSNN
ncbi:helix-turn-helix domain-containing protein [Tropicibacter sp. R15_0]|uniref:helix-turn-helix domain-containing protein n=1 Tax=Tropicibacter sp. R15_0 TaxID=2821101 RepID=UPI001AD9AD6D|nr:helix-turn-helix domain-containing protein [Tropicibacter sp. R15_0]MBO9464236.1 helix-turn-helix domain-containing protein [Tropicibacter sp. R15_0]